MTYNEFNTFCRALPATTYVMQWGGSHVWKVGGKVFAIGGWEDKPPAFIFKTTDLSFEILATQRGLRPAPYFASRGLKWIQHYATPGLSNAELRDYLRQSHAIVASGLTKRQRVELGLAPLGIEISKVQMPKRGSCKATSRRNARPTLKRQKAR